MKGILKEMGTSRDFGNPLVADEKSLLDLLPEFMEIWEERPIKKNYFGMTFNHSFGVFAIARILNLPNIVESGVWKGHSSYILRKACPHSRITSLDIDFGNLVYTDESITYLTEDFGHVDWSQLDPNETLCFFDDHVSSLQRLYEMKWWGFRFAIFEDNWPAGEGDSYSVRHILDHYAHDKLEKFSKKKITLKSLVKRALFESVLTRYYFHQHLLRRENNGDYIALIRNIDAYWEFPPLVKYPENNWGGSWAFPYDAKNGLLKLESNKKLIKLESEEPNRAFAYGYLALVKI